MPGEKISALIPVEKYDESQYLFMATKSGIVKKTSIKEYRNIRITGLIAINLKDDDELIEVKLTNNERDVFLVTKQGQCIRFNEKDVRTTGRSTMGVRGINLSMGDEVVAMQLDCQGEYLMIVSENGLGKRTRIDEFKCQNRGGKGVLCYKITEKTGNVVGVKSVNEENELMMITTEGVIIRFAVSSVSNLGRVTSGVKLINMDEDISVASIAKVKESALDNESDISQENSQQISEENSESDIVDIKDDSSESDISDNN